MKNKKTAIEKANTGKYDFIDTYSDDCKAVVVGKNGKYGYINQKGVEITPLKYDWAMRLSWDVGKVRLDGKWGLVNVHGKEITSLVYDKITGGKDPIVKMGKKYGIINADTGELLTPVKYDRIENRLQIDLINRKELARVKLGRKWGCINSSGEEIIPLKYEEIEICQQEKPRISAKLDGKWGFIEEDGTEVTNFEYDDVEFFCNGLARVMKNGKFGFINTKGEVVIQLVYDDCERHFYNIHYYKERILPIWVKRGDKYGFIDISGNVKVEPIYEQVKQFGYLGEKISLAAAVLNGAAGFIDETGKITIPFMYEPDLDNKTGYQFNDGFANVKFAGKWGVIDAQNREVVPFIYEKIHPDTGFRIAVRKGKKILIDSKGKEWKKKKNPSARTFKEYLHAVSWEDVEQSFRTLICKDREYMELELKIYQINFLNFKSKQSKPSNDLIRIYACNGIRNWNVSIYSVKKESAIGCVNWAEILDMEVRIEDNLTFTDPDIVALCIWEACDQVPTTEERIKEWINKIGEVAKTAMENI